MEVAYVMSFELLYFANVSTLFVTIKLFGPPGCGKTLIARQIGKGEKTNSVCFQPRLL